MHNPLNCVGYCLECEYTPRKECVYERWEDTLHDMMTDPKVHVEMMATAVQMGFVAYDKTNNDNMRISDVSKGVDVASGRDTGSFVVTTIGNRRFCVMVRELSDNELS